MPKTFNRSTKKPNKDKEMERNLRKAIEEFSSKHNLAEIISKMLIHVTTSNSDNPTLEMAKFLLQLDEKKSNEAGLTKIEEIENEINKFKMQIQSEEAEIQKIRSQQDDIEEQLKAHANAQQIKQEKVEAKVPARLLSVCDESGLELLSVTNLAVIDLVVGSPETIKEKLIKIIESAVITKKEKEQANPSLA